ncbi:MAG: hypothetical protein NUV77_27130, partial [Thermoguttaceae bacterium]|nr:hypothetical protein [Thermoguttaceae bacterium]
MLGADHCRPWKRYQATFRDRIEPWMTETALRQRETEAFAAREAELANALEAARAIVPDRKLIEQFADEVRRELRSFFASGTCLQELYVTPSRMTNQHWNDLAECATWALSRTDVLVDTHWVGGDPGTGEVYGWTSWSPERAVLALRNPIPFANSITLDLAQVFELPPDAPVRYRLHSPWREDKARAPMRLQAGTPHRFELQPFEVVVYDATPE